MVAGVKTANILNFWGSKEFKGVRKENRASKAEYEKTIIFKVYREIE